ncbi:DUF309 domain-containing protein [Chrysiogenes arsenatis]|uniref:DUF309 domain-containing protein n=1 Tax=Chrysiogenes arsenatis TaxID=309797 RepID=UPI0003FBA8E2|nr:DUF309 domain-containing protein [Chrysiogenes arsenatis]
MENDITERFAQALDLYHSYDFYECHEVLEDIWMELPEPDRLFYQGILQVAVAFLHCLKLPPNYTGALRLLSSARGKLLPFVPHTMGIDVTQLLDDVARAERYLQQWQEAGSPFDIGIVPTISRYQSGAASRADG